MFSYDCTTIKVFRSRVSNTNWVIKKAHNYCWAFIKLFYHAVVCQHCVNVRAIVLKIMITATLK